MPLPTALGRILVTGVVPAPTPIGGLLVKLFSWLQKRFRPSVRSNVRPGHGDKYRSRSYRFVERQKRDEAGGS